MAHEQHLLASKDEQVWNAAETAPYTILYHDYHSFDFWRREEAVRGSPARDSPVRFLLVMELRRLRSSRNQVRKRLAVGSGLAGSHPIWSLLSWSQWDREWLLSRVRCLKVARCWSIRFHALAGEHWRNGGDGPEHIWWWRSWRSAARTLIMWEIWSKQHLNIHLWFIYILVDMIWLGRIICNYICTGM